MPDVYILDQNVVLRQFPIYINRLGIYSQYMLEWRQCMEDKNSFLKRLKPGHWIGIITAAIALFYIGYLVGNVQGMRSLVPEGEPHVSNQGDISQVFIDDLDFLQFWQVWNLIKDNYVNRPVSEADLFYGALEGLVDGLDDPY